MGVSEEDALRASVRAKARAAREAHTHEAYAAEVLRVVQEAWRRRVPVEHVSPWFTDSEGTRSVHQDAREIVADLERAREDLPDLIPDLFEILRHELTPSR